MRRKVLLAQLTTVLCRVPAIRGPHPQALCCVRGRLGASASVTGFFGEVSGIQGMINPLHINYIKTTAAIYQELLCAKCLHIVVMKAESSLVENH